MRNLRAARRLRASREGLIEPPAFEYEQWRATAAMPQRRAPAPRGP
jgi:hypothetical protein